MVEGPLNNLKQSMVQFQKPKKVNALPSDDCCKVSCHVCFSLNQCYLVSRYIMTGDCSWAVVKVLCMGLGPQAKQQIREVAGGKVCTVYMFMLYLFYIDSYGSPSDSLLKSRTIICSLWPSKWGA